MKRVVLIAMMVLAACNQPDSETPGPGGGTASCPEHRNGLRYTADFIDPGETYIARSGNYWFRTNDDFLEGTKVTLKLENLPTTGFLRYNVYYGIDAIPFIAGNFEEKDPGGIPPSANISDVADTAGAYFVELEHWEFDLEKNGCATFQFALLTE